MTETPRQSRLAAIIDFARRVTMPGWALLGTLAFVTLALLFLAGRPEADRTPVASAADGRLAQLALRLDAMEAGLGRLAETLAGQTTRLGASDSQAQSAMQAQGQAMAALTARVASAESQAQLVTALASRAEELSRRLESGLAQAEAEQNRRIETQVAGAVTGLERRFAALEAQLRAVVAEEALRAALNAGRPLGPILDTMAMPPAPLARFARVAAPTEAQLRQGFDEAARAARGAAHARSGLLEATWVRLSALVLLRRAPDSLWSDAAETELEGARLALGEGDLAGVAERLARLPEVSQRAMAEWMAALRSVVEARAALTLLRTG